MEIAISVESTVAAEKLPELSEKYEVPRKAVEDLWRDGHVKLDGVFRPEEIAAYRPHLTRAVEARKDERHTVEQRVSGSQKNWYFVNNLWTQDPVARRFILSRRLGRIAADLLEVDAVRLFRDQSFFKGPGGVNTAWHQDDRYIPLETNKLATLWIPLTAITPDMAPMSYVTGSHKAGYFGIGGSDDASMDRFEEEVCTKGFKIFNYMTYGVGDISVHMAGTLHGSRANTSPIWREALVVMYFADGTRVAADLPITPSTPPTEVYASMIRKETRAISLAGLKPGEPATGPMTPLVYSRSWDEG